MPSRGSWDGGWSGAGRNYVIVRSMRDADAAALLGGKGKESWWHLWDDGWAACVTARLMDRGERTPKSDGFSGYDWMVRNILDHGDTRDRSAEGAESR
jgi:hypothetical protein